jgi:hypothetical protein
MRVPTGLESLIRQDYFSGGNVSRDFADSRPFRFSSAERAGTRITAACAMLARGGDPGGWNGPEVPVLELEFPLVLAFLLSLDRSARFSDTIPP